MKTKLHILGRDLKLFFNAWNSWIFRRLYKIFAAFEKVKKLVAMGLYRQRGRFARPFVHTAMGGLVAMSVVLAPVLANSFPGVQSDQVADLPPTSEITQVTDGGTVTQISDKVRDKVMDYTVQSGDTVSAIAAKFGISTDTLRWANDMTSVDVIKPGETLKILPVSGVLHTVSRGETVYTIAKKYSANPQAIVDFPFNTFADNETFALAVGQDLIVPDGKKVSESAPWTPSAPVYSQLTPNAGAVSGTGQFAWPISGIITQYFSWYHGGIDIATAYGTPIVAADSGVVLVAGWPDNSGYGNRVVIDHKNGFQTLCGHMSKVAVVAGQTVTRGEVIGYVGSTGRSTGPHCHFEIRKNGVRQNPLDYLR